MMGAMLMTAMTMATTVMMMTMMMMMMIMMIVMMAMKNTPGYTRGRGRRKKTDRAGDPTHYEGGGDDTAEKHTSIDF